MARVDDIRQTMKNMESMYRDFGAVVRVIERLMKNSGFKALGDANGTWDISTSYRNPDLWLYRSFVRAYARETLVRRCVGFCMHFGAYNDSDVEALSALRVRLPAISMSALMLDADFKKTQASLYRTLFRAGWKDVRNAQPERDTIIRSTVTKERNRVGATAVTYFVDLLDLVSREAIHRLVAEPMVRMYDGEDQFVAESGLPVIQVAGVEETPASAGPQEKGG
jgi:hypothetical protein